MATKRVINIKSVAADIQSGLSDTELMERYGLTAKNLSTVLDKLVEFQLITFDDLQQRQAEFEEEEVYTPPSEFRAWERDEVFEVDRVVCEASCRWIKPAREDRGCISGYEVMKFLSGDLKTIQVLMKGLTLEERIALRDKREA